MFFIFLTLVKINSMKKIILFLFLSISIFSCKKNETSKVSSEKNETINSDTVTTNNVEISPISHATAVISYENEIIYIDPTGGAEAFDDFETPTYVLITDIHGDHMNLKTLNALELSKTIIIATKALKIDDASVLYWRKYSEINIKLNFFEEAVDGFKNCLNLNDNELEIYIALADLLSFLGEFNDSLSTLFKAQKIYKNSAEIEYRLCGLFFVLNKEKYSLNHLINGMKIDYDYNTILKELYPTVLDSTKISKLLGNYKKALE